MANCSQRALIYWFLFHEDSVLDSGFARRNSWMMTWILRKKLLSGRKGGDLRKESISFNTFFKILHTTQWKVFLVWFVDFSKLAKSAFLKVLWCPIFLVSDCSKRTSESFSGSLMQMVQSPGFRIWSFMGLLLNRVHTCTHWYYWHTALGASRVTGRYSTASFPPPTLVRPAYTPKQGKKLQIPGLNLWNLFGVCLVVTSSTFSIFFTGCAVNSNHKCRLYNWIKFRN